MKEVEYFLDKKSLFYPRAIQGDSGGIPIRPGMMGYTFILENWKEFYISAEMITENRVADFIFSNE